MSDQSTSPRLALEALPARATNVRWGILALLMAFAWFCHFNRNSIAAAGAEHLMREYEISKTQMGMVYSAYLFVYTLCMVPGGWLIDRIGPKRALAILGLGSAILVPMTGLTSYAPAGGILLALVVVRACLGIVNAPMHPAAARAVSYWIPRDSRGVANGLITGAALVGVASPPFVFGLLMDSMGWPKAFLAAGIATLLLSLLWMAYAADRPAGHAGVNARERELIDADDRSVRNGEPPPRTTGDLQPALRVSERVAPEDDASGGLLSMFRNRGLVLLTASYACVSYFQYMFFYWMQAYFGDELKLDEATTRLYTTIVLLAMAIGMMCGGRIADLAQARIGGRLGRAIVPCSGMIASAVLLVVGILSSNPAWIVTWFALALGALGTGESSFWVFGIQLGGRRGGLSGAFLNTGGNLGGIPAPYFTPWISDHYGWPAALGLASALCIAGAALWRWIDVEER